jgi:hypothetical protein
MWPVRCTYVPKLKLLHKIKLFKNLELQLKSPTDYSSKYKVISVVLQYHTEMQNRLFYFALN